MNNLEIDTSLKKGGKDDTMINKQKGDAYVKTSCIMCKFKPNYEDAIPFYKLAADGFHGQNNIKEEIYCREKLAVCFRNLVSEWEEGNEYNKIAVLQVKNLQDYNAALQTIQNAYNSFFIKGEYKYSIDCVTKLSEKFIELNETAFAEKCLKMAFEGVLTVFHSIASKPDEPTDFLYSAINRYMAINFKLNKIDTIVDSADKLIKVIEPYETSKSQVANMYGYHLIGLMLKEDKVAFGDVAAKAKGSLDYREAMMISNVENMYENLCNLNEMQFKNNVRELEYDHEVGKYLLNLFKDRKEKNKIESKDIEIKVIEEMDDYR
jgi:hypothetical protein